MSLDDSANESDIQDQQPTEATDDSKQILIIEMVCSWMFVV